MDELPVWLNSVDDTQRMGGYTKAELMNMPETERFNAIKNWTIQDMQTSKVYFNDKGKKIWQTYFGSDGKYQVGKIEFYDGTVWGLDEIRDRTRIIRGSETADDIYGYERGYNYDTSEIICAGAGDDAVRAQSGNDIVYGGSGNDMIMGMNGNDIIVGGKGDDSLSFLIL